MSSSSSSDEDDILFNSSLTKWYFIQNRRKKTVHPLNKKRSQFGEFHHLFNDLRIDNQRFFEYMRMSIDTFDYIIEKIGHKVNITWKNCHSQPITIEERLMLTLRYIWDSLYEIHMPVPSNGDFQQITKDFYEIWNFPNCIGALDGKHIRMRCPNNCGSLYFNYKGYFSIVLQALVEANYKFINIDVGGYGKQSDGGTFKASALYRKIINGTLNLPEDSLLPNSNLSMPHVIIADEAYPLMRNLVKLYSKQELNEVKEYFNKRLSRARQTVECAFGIIRSKWQILDKPILTSAEHADKIIKTVCLLHNIIINKEGIEHNLRDIQSTFQNENIQAPAGRPNSEAKYIREAFKNFCCNNPI
nr:unnamed protein product [Callosobruchus chinensis]